MAVAIKRYTRAARELHDKPQRHQRNFTTREAAVAAAQKWFEDPMVKAVWAYDNGVELFHANLRDNPRS